MFCCGHLMKQISLFCFCMPVLLICTLDSLQMSKEAYAMLFLGPSMNRAL